MIALYNPTIIPVYSFFSHSNNLENPGFFHGFSQDVSGKSHRNPIGLPFGKWSTNRGLDHFQGCFHRIVRGCWEDGIHIPGKHGKVGGERGVGWIRDGFWPGWATFFLEIREKWWSWPAGIEDIWQMWTTTNRVVWKETGKMVWLRYSGPTVLVATSVRFGTGYSHLVQASFEAANHPPPHCGSCLKLWMTRKPGNGVSIAMSVHWEKWYD